MAILILSVFSLKFYKLYYIIISLGYCRITIIYLFIFLYWGGTQDLSKDYNWASSQLFFRILVWDPFSLTCSDCPRTHYIGWSWNFSHLASASQVAGITRRCCHFMLWLLLLLWIHWYFTSQHRILTTVVHDQHRVEYCLLYSHPRGTWTYFLQFFYCLILTWILVWFVILIRLVSNSVAQQSFCLSLPGSGSPSMHHHTCCVLIFKKNS